MNDSSDQDEDTHAEVSPGADATGSARTPPDRNALEAAVKKGEGVEKIWRNSFEPLFDQPDAIVETCESLAICFKDQPEWLADLVRPAHLLKELSNGSTHVTALVLGYWARAGETHKLARLADHLLQAAPRLKTPLAGRMMVLLASSLGILRPRRSTDLLAMATPLLSKLGTDDELLDEARQWVNAGHLLQSVDTDERTFWNQRLRMPQSTWDWQSEQAQQAIVKLRGMLHPESTAAPLFLAALPADIRQSFEPDADGAKPAKAPATTTDQAPSEGNDRNEDAEQKPARDAGNESVPDKLPDPEAGSAGDATPQSPPEQEPEQARATEKASSTKKEPQSPPPEQELATAPSIQQPAADQEPAKAAAQSSGDGASRSRSTFPAWFGGAMTGALAVTACWCWQPQWIEPLRQQLVERGMLSFPSSEANTATTAPPISLLVTSSAAGTTPPADSPPAELSAAPVSKAATEATKEDPTRQFPAWRQEAIKQLERNHPAVGRWHAMIKAGPLEDNLPLLLGRRSFLPASDPDYPVLLKWLMLDPPAEPEARAAVARLIINRADQKEVVPLLDKLAYAGSPNATEVEEACRLMLDLPKRRWTTEERTILETIANGQLKADAPVPAKP